MGERRALRACCLLLSALASTPACTMRNPAFIAPAANEKRDAAALDVPQASDGAREVPTDVRQDGPALDPIDATSSDAVFDARADLISAVAADAGSDADTAPPRIDAAGLSIDDRITMSASNLNRWTYNGSGWTWCYTCTTGEALYAGTNTWSRVAGDEAILNFQGSVVTLYGVLDPAHGIAVVSLDGAAQMEVDFYAAARAGNQPVWTMVINGAVTTHQLKIQITGRRRSAATDANVAIDRVEID